VSGSCGAQNTLYELLPHRVLLNAVAASGGGPNSLLQQAFQTFCACRVDNYARVLSAFAAHCRDDCVAALCMLPACVPAMRKHAVSCMDRTYMPKGCVPLITVTALLGFGNEDAAATYCASVAGLPLVITATAATATTTTTTTTTAVRFKSSSGGGGGTTTALFPSTAAAVVATNATMRSDLERIRGALSVAQWLCSLFQ
jgi:hypothetical protein